MSKIERMQKYIQRTGMDAKMVHRYSMSASETTELLEQTIKSDGNEVGNALDNLVLAFEYGMAKGYRAGKKEISA